MLIKKLKVEVMDKSKIEKVQPEQVQNSEQKADDNSVSPAFANALVVGSQSLMSDLSEMSKIWLSPEYLEKRKQSYDALFKMWAEEDSSPLP